MNSKNQIKEKLIIDYIKEKAAKGETVSSSKMKKELKIHHVNGEYINPKFLEIFAKNNNIQIKSARKHPNNRKIKNADDLIGLGKISDKKLAKIHGVSGTLIRNYRIAKGIDPKRKLISNEKKLEIIKAYLLENPVIDTCQKLFEVWGFCKIDGKPITKETLKKICQNHNLSLKIKSDNLIQEKITIDSSLFHDLKRFDIGKCRCNICKLCNSILISFNSKFGINLKSEFCDYFANKYLDNYEKDKTRYKDNFYKFIKQQYDIMSHAYVTSKLEELKDIKTNKKYLKEIIFESFEETPRFF